MVGEFADSVGVKGSRPRASYVTMYTSQMA